MGSGVRPWYKASDGGTYDVHDPATGEMLATLASTTSEDALDLVPEWAEDFAPLMTLKRGKPLAEARGEAARPMDSTSFRSSVDKSASF